MIRWSAKEVGQRLREMPMLRVFLPVCGGILTEQIVHFPPLYLWGGLFVAGCCALLFRSSFYLLVALLLLGLGCASLHRCKVAPPVGEEALFILSVEANPTLRDRYTTAPARIEAWCDHQGVWRSSEKRLNLYADSTLQLQVGEELTLIGRLRPYPHKNSFYARLQHARGYTGMLWAGNKQVIHRDTTLQLGVVGRLHQRALESIERLNLGEENQAVVEAMTIGERRGMPPLLRQQYARSGTSHLLAVSGLHVGILYLLLNMLFFGLPLLQGGHRIKNGVVLLFIWIYALVSGASPSVLRAAWMFSALQLAQGFSLRYRGLNILFGVAVILLLLEPSSLFDVSFQLSFLAVAAILSWAVPLLRGLHNRFVKGLAVLFLIGGMATLATAPLAIYRFGLFAPIGILLNPLVILSAEVILASTLVWIVLPFDLWLPLFSFVIEGAASLQNGLLGWISEREWAAFELHFNGITTLFVYLSLVLLTLFAWGIKRQKRLKPEYDDFG